MSSKYASTARSTSAQVVPGTERGEGHLLGGDRVVEEAAHLVGRRADDHRALELGVVAPDRRARLGDEDVALLELDVVGDRVRPGAAQADLAAVAGRDAVGGRLLAAVRAVERLQHRERRLVSRPQARLGLGRSGPRVLLQQAVGVLAPARALADQADLGLALAHHHALDERRERENGLPRDLAQRRALVAEDARIAVLVGAGGAGDPELPQHAGQDPQRMLDPRVLRVRLDPLEGGLRAHPLDLELGHEGGEVAGRVADDGDRPLGREEVEAGEVADVVVAEEREAGQLVARAGARAALRVASAALPQPMPVVGSMRHNLSDRREVPDAVAMRPPIEGWRNGGD